MNIYDHDHTWVTHGKWWINFNEGGKWFTFWFNPRSFMIFRIWFGPIVNDLVLFSIAFAIFNPWKNDV